MSSSNKLYFSVEEDEKLIESVRKHGAIFNLQHSMYRDTRVKDNIWKEVAECVERSGSVGSSVKQRCLDGSMWKRGCNDCYCENGIPFCHSLPCHLPRGVVRTPCQSGSTWKVDCNLCVCKTGIPVCSSLACPSTSNGVIRNERCIEAKMWKNGCNDCFCYFGLVACSVKPCNSTEHGSLSSERVAMWKPTLMFEIGESKNTQCIPGTSWKQKCNYCFCSYGIPACTMRDCSLEGAVTASISEFRSSPSSMINVEEPLTSTTIKEEILPYPCYGYELTTTELPKTSEATPSKCFQALTTPTSEPIEYFSQTETTSKQETTE